MELLPAASEQEAAAIAAAIARFDADTAPAPAPARAPRESRWLRAARLEGVARGAAAAPTWGDPVAGSAGP